MLVFGGQAPSSQLNDVWAFDLAAQTWALVPTLGTAPGVRSDLASVLDSTRDRWLFVGGRVGFDLSIDEVWSLSLATNEWTRLPAGPSARHDIAAATDGSRMWVFGGAGVLFQSLDDLWEFDLATNTWRLLPTSDPHPVARTSYALAYHQGALYMRGGHDVARAFNETWRYDLAASKWEQLATTGGAAAHAHFGFVYDAQCASIFMSGGDNLDNFVVGTTEVLKLGNQPTFTRLRASRIPAPRDHSSLVLDETRRQLILMGGGSLGDGLDTFGDTWTYSLAACP